MEELRVLAVGAHPDDLEILCGGTLARYAESGHQVVMAHVLSGDKGHYKTDSASLAKIREKEAEEAGRLIGAEVIDLGLPDAELIPDGATSFASTSSASDRTFLILETNLHPY